MGGVPRGYEGPTYCPDIDCPLWPWRKTQGVDRTFKIRRPSEKYYARNGTEA
jgi:hypothetical protein